MRDEFHRISNPKLRDFYTKAKSFIEANKSTVALVSSDPEFVAWGEYFSRLGVRPITFTMAANDPKGERMWTAPAQWPEWFERSALAGNVTYAQITHDRQREAAE